MNNSDPEIEYLNDFQQSVHCNNLSFLEFTDLFKNSDQCMLNILNYNVRSFECNKSHFLPLIEKASPSIFISTETWLNDSYLPNIDGYDSYHTVRNDRQSGGVSIFVNESLNSKKNR